MSATTSPTRNAIIAVLRLLAVAYIAWNVFGLLAAAVHHLTGSPRAPAIALALSATVLAVIVEAVLQASGIEVPPQDDPTVCPDCAYSLEGLEGRNRCPECGVVFGQD